MIFTLPVEKWTMTPMQKEKYILWQQNYQTILIAGKGDAILTNEGNRLQNQNLQN